MPASTAPGVRLLPNAVTVLALCSGLSGVQFMLTGNHVAAIAAIALAGVFDALDGRLARLLDATSRIGAELDSLSDCISFGVSPALILFLWQLHDLRVGWVVALVLVVSTALRLARFNTLSDDEEAPPFAGEFFVGVPSPAGALVALTPLATELLLGPGWWSAPVTVAIWTVFSAGLMISRIPTSSLKSVRVPPAAVAPALVLVALAAAAVVAVPFALYPVAILLYLAHIPYADVPVPLAGAPSRGLARAAAPAPGGPARPPPARSPAPAPPAAAPRRRGRRPGGASHDEPRAGRRPAPGLATARGERRAAGPGPAPAGPARPGPARRRARPARARTPAGAPVTGAQVPQVTLDRPALDVGRRRPPRGGPAARRGARRARPDAWDAVRVVGTRATVALAAPATGPVSPGTATLDETAMVNAGIVAGTSVAVEPVAVTAARTITVAGSRLASTSVAPETVRLALTGKVLTPGDTVSLLPQDLAPVPGADAAGTRYAAVGRAGRHVDDGAGHGGHRGARCGRGATSWGRAPSSSGRAGRGRGRRREPARGPRPMGADRVLRRASPERPRGARPRARGGVGRCPRAARRPRRPPRPCRRPPRRSRRHPR